MNYPWLDEYLLSRPGAEKDFKVEWGWLRYRVCGRLFAALCHDREGNEILTLKLEPLEGEFLRGQFGDIVPGYYCDKRHWNSVRLDGTVPDGLMRHMIDQSYALVCAKVPLKARRAAGLVP